MDTPATLFTYARCPQFGDTDAAAIVYTGRYPQFGLEAIDAWWLERIGTDWFRMLKEHGFGTPMVHMSFDFKRPLVPHEDLVMTVGLKRIGRSSLHFAVPGRVGPDLCFEAAFVSAFIHIETRQPIPIPERYAAAIAREHKIYLGKIAPPEA
jgi:4-hydroxybenzoyl-CoA thioesterase